MTMMQTRTKSASSPSAAHRVDWVDYAKGWCIILVVMMHSTLGYGEAVGSEGWLHEVVAFAKPFRMPDFFLISGLFLARAIDRDLITFIDRKVVHFLYFYLVWLVIQTVLRNGSVVFDDPQAFAFLLTQGLIEPLGTLWFIHVLPIMFMAARLLRRLPWPIVLVVAAALQVAPVATGWTAIDEFAERFVYFYAGYVLAPRIFAFAAAVTARPMLALGALCVWALVNGAAVQSGLSDAPGLALALGFLGACAVVAISALMAQSHRLGFLRLCGERSLPIYLSFFLFMSGARIVLLKTGLIADVGLASLVITACGVVGSLVLHEIVRRTPLRWLFERPAWVRLARRDTPATRLAPAE